MGAVFSIFGGFYYWFDNLLGSYYSESLGQIHFWSFFIGVNFTFFPMHYLGVAGLPRRVPDFPDSFSFFNKLATCGSVISLLSVAIFFCVIIDAFILNKDYSYESHLIVKEKKLSLITT